MLMLFLARCNKEKRKLMLHKKWLLFLCSLIICFQTTAQNASNKKINLQTYSGGMMFHTGYLSDGKVNVHNSQAPVQLQGTPFGIGGLLRFHINEHFRIGGEGYTSTLHYGKNKSYMTLGWGGLLLDSPWKINHFTVFAGTTIGGGSIKNIAVTDNPSHSIETNALYRKYSVMLIDPFIGMEYAISSKIHLITKIDWIVPLSEKQSDWATGFRVYLGIVFVHEKK